MSALESWVRDCRFFKNGIKIILHMYVTCRDGISKFTTILSNHNPAP